MGRTYRDPLKGRTTTYGELDRETRDPGYRLCVRCGLLKPAPELFVCGRCQDDPDAIAERLIVEETIVDYADQRRALVELYGWRGGWWR